MVHVLHVYSPRSPLSPAFPQQLHSRSRAPVHISTCKNGWAPLKASSGAYNFETAIMKVKSGPAKSMMSKSIISRARLNRVMGGSGTGKTTFVNLASGSKFGIGEGLESCTNAVQSHKFLFDGKEISLIDVPGFDDTTKSDIELLQLITDFLIAEYKVNRLLTGILYFHRISDVRMGGAAKRNLAMFQKLCGSNAFKNVAIVTTRWDKEEESIALARYNELSRKPQLFQPILEGGTEIVNERKHMVETAAGAELHRDIMEQVEAHQKELAELMEEMEKNNGSDMSDLEGECQELRARMTHWYTEAEKLSDTKMVRPQVESGVKKSILAASGFVSRQHQPTLVAATSGSTLTSSQGSDTFQSAETSSNPTSAMSQREDTAMISAQRVGRDREVRKKRLLALMHRIQATMKSVSEEVKDIFGF
ncbi:hypothetical protein D9757_013409 [Collybiopsis confluens]|uniref:AIG1-type G domain-containing protein n=1 Tax=Collybiopsis confluens TaxID=2823264 RepID=A0A8H5D6J3_9AGAR|nr:hypothetical protein D9757_013409 [Collybiopsis confluens]